MVFGKPSDNSRAAKKSKDTSTTDYLNTTGIEQRLYYRMTPLKRTKTHTKIPTTFLSR
jgi:hypothetical protein